jgi:hypothetical protein
MTIQKLLKIQMMIDASPIATLTEGGILNSFLQIPDGIEKTKFTLSSLSIVDHMIEGSFEYFFKADPSKKTFKFEENPYDSPKKMLEETKPRRCHICWIAPPYLYSPSSGPTPPEAFFVGSDTTY